ncbi:unnamed protein product [Brassica napus]|uniref:(rape) hypothetical protein n=1 Tax=Brassica napus TaxID=3708 RepID=A0A816SMK0_BRANA|nr:unnamed protein product [Brassica napus]
MAGDAETQTSSTKRHGGGWITFPFMIATLLGLTIAAWGWLLNLIVYLIEEFNVKSIAAAQITNIFSGCICMVPAIGAIAADSFFGTIPVISVSAFVALVGVSLLTLTAALDSLRPNPCDTASSLCQSPSKSQLGVLYTAITLASIGTGGTRFTLATAGANQYEKTKDQGSFFNWFFFTTYLAGAISATAIVYSEDNVSWTFGFGLCVAANFFSFLVFILGRRFYKHDKPLGSPFTSLLRVIFAAVFKRKAVVSTNEKDYHSESLSMPTNSLRFFNRAALKQEDEVKPDGTVHNPWRLCSVQQVEDFKAVIRIIPLALAIIFLSTPIAMQLSLTVLQGLVMDRRLGPNFKIPAGSLQVITLLSTCLFIMVNDRLLYPFYQRLTGKFLTPLQQVGIGHVFNILSMAVTAIVEAKRLKIVENGHFLESSSIADMSVLWLFPPLVIVGIGEAFHFPGNVALCYQEFPESMRSTATSITSVVIGICFYTSTALIDLIQRTTAWLPDDINHGRVDNVYWVLVIGGVLNLGYFLVCSWLYKYRNLEDDVSGDIEVQHSGDPSSKRGGWITFPFIIVTLLGLSITSFGVILNLIVFLIEEFNIKSIAAAQISNIFNGCLAMLPVVAAILADSFFGDIPIILASTFISLLVNPKLIEALLSIYTKGSPFPKRLFQGISLLTLIAFSDYLRPRPCEPGSILCQSPSDLQLGIIYVVLALVTTGTAETRVALASAGANQYEKPKDQGTFFNCYFLMVNTGAIISATAIVYTQDNASWKLGFGLCAAANLISFILFISGKRLYKHNKPMGSPFTSLVRVIVAATVKRKAVISSKDEDYYHHGLGQKNKNSAVVPSQSFRFFNRATLKTKGESGDTTNNKWRLCSVQEVEDFKAVLRLLPLWLSIIFVSIPIAVQSSLMVLQALVTDRVLSPHFKVSAGSIQVIAIIFSCIFIIMNNWLFYPMYHKLTNKVMTPLQKIGMGHVFTILSMVISAVVESKRLKTVQNEHLMSVLWLFPPFVILGISEAFQLPAHIELFYGEFPESLRNTATSLTSLVIGITFYLSTALIDLIQRTTAWLPDDINHGRVDNVYWVLVTGGVLNFGYFLVCSWFYNYRFLRDNGQEQDPKDVII